MNKVELRKVMPGVLLRIRWNDTSDSVAMLVDKPNWNQKGDISLHCFQIDDKGVGYTDNNIDHTQVVEVLSPLDHPFTEHMLNHQKKLV